MLLLPHNSVKALFQSLASLLPPPPLVRVCHVPSGGTLGVDLVLHVGGYFWKRYSQVIRASPGCYEVCPSLVVSPDPDLCKKGRQVHTVRTDQL